jgi:hypothetical protein
MSVNRNDTVPVGNGSDPARGPSDGAVVVSPDIVEDYVVGDAVAVALVVLAMCGFLVVARNSVTAPCA